MSREGVVKLITRALEDESFRTQIKANPDAALAQFDLTPDEKAAIKTGDASRLGDVAMDERVSKVASTSLIAPSSQTTSLIAPSSQQESVIYWLIGLFKA